VKLDHIINMNGRPMRHLANLIKLVHGEHLCKLCH